MSKEAKDMIQEERQATQKNTVSRKEWKGENIIKNVLYIL